MKQPPNLYRFRGLSAEIIDREIQSLTESYVYSPAFSSMNDPMEAFYETGGPGDHIIDAMFAPKQKLTKDLNRMLDETIAKFALISFTGTYKSLPLWAYYANNFAGICLEFSTKDLIIGDLKSERLLPVVYARDALPPIDVLRLGSDNIGDAVIKRLTRKRIEWAHEKEWRFVTGQVGPKHYLDDALKRVYLGPRIDADHAGRICDTLKRRPVEVLQGQIRGFALEFTTLQKAAALEDCERVGSGRFEPSDDLFAEPDLRAFFGAEYDKLVAECRASALRPNMDGFGGIDIAGSERNRVYLWTQYKLRNGGIAFDKRYFDKRMRQVG